MNADDNAAPTGVTLMGWRPGRLAKLGGELFVWLFARACAQAALVVAFARNLGPTDYGSFVAITAIGVATSSLAGLGLPSVLLRDGARSHSSIARLLGDMLRVLRHSILIFAAISAALALIVLPSSAIPPILVVVLAATEVAAIAQVELIGRAFQATSNIRYFGAIQAGLPCVRMICILTLLIFDIRNLNSWLWTYALVGVAYIFAVTQVARAKIGWIRSGQPGWPIIREGLPFTSGAVAARLQAEFNKPLLAHAAFSDAGMFNIAQRATDLVSLPLIALQDALWPNLYRTDNHWRRLLKSGAALLGLSIATMLTVIVISALAPLVLGEAYRNASRLMIALSALPAISLLRALACFHLIATDRAPALAKVYFTGAVTSIATATLLIPNVGVLGAVLSCYASEVAALVVIFVVTRLARQK